MNIFKNFIQFSIFTLACDSLKLKCVEKYGKYRNCIADGFDDIDGHLEIYCDHNAELFNLIILPNRRLDLNNNSHISLRDCSISQIVLNNFRSLSPESVITVEYDSVKLFLYNSDFVFDSFDMKNFTPVQLEWNSIGILSK